METKNNHKQTKDLKIIATETRAKYLKDSQNLRNSILLAKQKLNITEQDVGIEEPIKPTTSRKTFLDLIDKATQPIAEEEAQT